MKAIVDLLKGDSRAKWFIIVPVSGPGLPTIAAGSATAKEPSLIKLAGSPLGRSLAGDVLEIGTRRVKIVDGKPLFQDGKPVFIPVFEGDIKVGDLADACLYLGTAQPTLVQPPSGLYDRTKYGVEIQRRRSLLNLAMSQK